MQSRPFPAPSTQVYVPFCYFEYIETPNMRHLSPEQVHALEAKGCLRVPSGPTLNEFVRQYFLYVHPCLPLLDEGRFWSMYCGRAESPAPTISLALFQAMLFAASRVRRYKARLTIYSG